MLKTITEDKPYYIVAQYLGQPREITDEADTLKEAKLMREEYDLVFGGTCHVCIKRLHQLQATAEGRDLLEEWQGE